MTDELTHPHEQRIGECRTLLDAMLDSVWVIDTNGEVLDVNQRAVELLGYSKEELRAIGLPGIDASLSELQIRDLVYRMPTDKAQTFETAHRTKDGLSIPVEVNSSLTRYHGQPVILSVARDISERKETEEALKRQISEKSILLRESIHRVKNDIATIVGLLSMQAQSAASPEAASALKEAVARVSGMGELYAKMLLSETHSEIRIDSYLNDIVESVVSLSSISIPVTFEKQFDAFSMDSKRLFYLGLMVNELLTNTIKYAFEGMTSGHVCITAQNSDGLVTLRVTDNGTGLPPQFNAHISGGFGLELVRMLVEQLSGRFELVSQNGTWAAISFQL